MSSKKKKDKPHMELTNSIDPEGSPETSGAAPVEVVQAEATPEPQTPEQQIEALRDETLRLMAELRNVRQRAQREKQEALKYAEADFARELLVVLDDLERTQESAKSAEDVQAVAEGVRIVYEHFVKLLRGRQIEPIEALGQPFDPDLHEALMQQPSDECPAGIVMQELARGYRMHGRVIRSAKVVVSSGPAAPAGAAASEEPAAAEDQEERDADV